MVGSGNYKTQNYEDGRLREMTTFGSFVKNPINYNLRLLRTIEDGHILGVGKLVSNQTFNLNSSLQYPDRRGQ